MMLETAKVTGWVVSKGFPVPKEKEIHLEVDSNGASLNLTTLIHFTFIVF